MVGYSFLGTSWAGVWPLRLLGEFDFLGASSSEKASQKWDLTIPGKLRWGRGRRHPLIGCALRGNSWAEFPASLDVIDF